MNRNNILEIRPPQSAGKTRPLLLEGRALRSFSSISVESISLIKQSSIAAWTCKLCSYTCNQNSSSCPICGSDRTNMNFTSGKKTLITPSKSLPHAGDCLERKKNKSHSHKAGRAARDQKEGCDGRARPTSPASLSSDDTPPPLRNKPRQDEDGHSARPSHRPMRRKISSPERPKATSNASEEAMQRGIEERGKRNSDSHGARRDASVDLRNDLTPFRQSFFHRPMDPTSAEKHSRSTTPALEESLHQEDLWNSAEVSLSGNEANGSRHTSLPNARARFDGLVDEEGGAWVCSACTFVNENALHLSCSICGTQRDKARRETSISSTSYTPYFTAQEVPGELHEDFQQEAIRSRSEQIEGEWFAELQQKRMKELIQLQLELFEEYGRDGSEAEPDDVSVGNTDCHPMSTTGSVSCTVAKQNGTVASDNLDFAEQNRILDQRRESLLNREQQLQDFQLRQKALWKLSAERVEAEN